MSTTLEFKFMAGGALTNATSVVLADPTSAYGVKRLDSNAIVAASGTAMTNSATGVYRYELANVGGADVSWWVRVVYNGVTYHFERESGTATSGQLLEKWYVAEPPAGDGAVCDSDTCNAQCRLQGEVATASAPLVALYHLAAVQFAEDAMSCVLVQRTIVANFYDNERLKLPRGPVMSISSVVDGSGNTINADQYTVKHVGHALYIVPNGGITYPVTVTYRAGYGDATAVPARFKAPILTHTGTLYLNRESISEKSKLAVPHSLDAFYRLNRRSAPIA